MKDIEIPGKVEQSVLKQVHERGYCTPVDVLLDLGVLTKQDYLNWRNGKVDYLERVCHTNLSKLTKINKAIRSSARKHAYKPSVTVYRQWGNKKRTLRFSKSNNPEIERSYATHYVNPYNKNQETDRHGGETDGNR